MLKKAGFFLVLIILLSIGIFAQGFGFDFQYGGSRSGYVSSGVAGAITSALDIIFGGVVGPLFDAIEFNFYGATKLALWIILYLIFSNIFKNYFSKKGMHNKFSKVIAAIMALFSVVFIPASVLDLVFRDMLGGLVGILLLAAVIGFPLYYLFKWSRENREDRAVNLVSALLFFLLMIVFSQLNNQFVFAFTNGLVQSITSLAVSFGILFALIMCIHRAYLGFKGIGGGSSRADAEESERPREDKFKEAKALAQQAVRQLNLMGQSIDSLSNDANGIAHQLTRQPRGLDFANRLDLTNLDNTIERLANILNKNNKVDLANEILQEHNRMNEAVNHFIPVRKHLETQLDHARRGHVDIAYFSDLINKIENLDSNIRSLARSLLKTGRL
ncbi:hypothetical protein HYT56_03465 [Candidatus Woesearchaeota archaeon]|nr:hypothetical protein [Candidatus Woesearchaeota archaeon]